jgi:hypothetical protein
VASKKPKHWEPPADFNILEQSWRTVYTGEMEEATLGMVIPKKAIVYLDSRQSESLIGETWLHEVCHIIFQESGLREIDGLPQMEETIVTAFGAQLWALLRRNKLRFDQ